MDKDFLKEKIAYYKLWITILTTIDVSVIAWFFNNYNKINYIKFSFLWITIFTGIIATIILNKKARNYLKKLGENYGN